MAKEKGGSFGDRELQKGYVISDNLLYNTAANRDEAIVLQKIEKAKLWAYGHKYAKTDVRRNKRKRLA